MSPNKSQKKPSKRAGSASKANPFETLAIGRKKHTVLGQAPSLKHPSQLQKLAYNKRNEALGKEFASLHKTNRFVDERPDSFHGKTVSKKGQTREMFNLNLTHRGQTLYEIEHLDRVPDGVDDDEDEVLPDAFTSKTHFGGGSDDERNGKDRNTVIEEMIAYSKRQKAARQQENDELYEMRQKLDTDLGDLMPFLKAHIRKDIDPIKPDAYDRTVREMIFDPQGTKREKDKLPRPKDVYSDAKQHVSVDALFAVPTSENNCTRESVPEVVIESAELNANLIDVPKEYDQFANMLDANNLPGEQMRLLVGMIETLKKKSFLHKSRWSMLFSNTLRYIVDRFAQTNDSSITKQFQTLHLLTPLLHDMAQNDPSGVGKVYLELLQEKYVEFKKRPERYPDMETLVLLKLVPVLFAVSERRNSIATSALIFIGEVLTRSQVRDRRHITRGLLLVTTALECGEQSKRFLPAAIAFLSGVLGQACPEESLVSTTTIRQPFRLSSSLMLHTEDELKNVIESSTEFQLTAQDLLTREITPSFKMRATVCTVSLVDALCTQLQHLVAVPIFAQHFLHLLQVVQKTSCSSLVKKPLQKTIEKLNELSKRSLSYLVKKEKNPKPCRLLEPKINPIYDGVQRRLKTVEPLRVQRRKLQQKLKKATRIAKRDIRLDNQFVAKLRHNVRVECDRERKSKVRTIFTHIASQQAELKSFDRKAKHRG